MKLKRLLSLLLSLCLLTALFVSSSVLSVGAVTSGIKTKDEAVNWLNAQNNATYDFNGANGTQCVEFVKAYVNWLLCGNAWQDCWNRPTGNGNTIWQNSLWGELGWTVYDNTSDFVPQPGDIFSAGLNNGNHTGVVISSDINQAVIADANARDKEWSNGDPVYIHTITWKSASSDSPYGATHFIRPVFSNTSISYETITPGTYYLQSTYNDQYLTVNGGLDVNEQGISLADFGASAAQQIIVSPATNGYTLRPACSSNRVVNPYADTVVSGTKVNLYDAASGSVASSQWWLFEAVEGGYIIHNAQNPSVVLDVDGNHNIVVATRHGGPSQVWRLTPPEHTCNKDGGYQYFLKSHPHHDCYKCSICNDVWADTSTGRYYDLCETCTMVTYTVTFVGKDGQTLKTERVNRGEAATAPSAPVVEGYTFKGWDKAFDSIDADTVVTAQYTRNTYTVTFVDQDGNNLKTERVEYGLSATAPVVPAVQGLVYLGWDCSFETVTSDLVVSAVFALASSGGDLNGDGEVSLGDLTMMAQYLAGYDISLG